VAVMYLGQIVEQGDVRTLIHSPKHPYTMMLLRSLPGLSKGKSRLSSIEGTVPSLLDVPSGCPFHPRCPFAVKGRCDQGDRPVLTPVSDEHGVACLRWNEIDAEELNHINVEASP
jgi:oligopeptide/dipeptide ABC transporter ATP-binding protein